MTNTCDQCGKEIGFLREVYSFNDFQDAKVPFPVNSSKDAKFCSDCFNSLRDAYRKTIPKRPTGALYLLPIFMGLLGGVLMYIAVKDQDQGMANSGMWVGVILTFFQVVAFLFYWGTIISLLPISI